MLALRWMLLGWILFGIWRIQFFAWATTIVDDGGGGGVCIWRHCWKRWNVVVSDKNAYGNVSIRVLRCSALTFHSHTLKSQTQTHTHKHWTTRRRTYINWVRFVFVLCFASFYSLVGCFISSTGMALPCYAQISSKKNKCDSTSESMPFVCFCCCRRRFFFLSYFVCCFLSKKKCHMEFARFSASPIQQKTCFKKTCFLFLSTISIKLLFYVLLFLSSRFTIDFTNEMHTDFICRSFVRSSVLFPFVCLVFSFFLIIFFFISVVSSVIGCTIN